MTFLKRHIRSTKDLCPACLYPLVFLDGRARCTECGSRWVPTDLVLAAQLRSARRVGCIEFIFLGIALFCTVMFGQPSYIFSNTVGIVDVFTLVLFLGIPLWSIPIAWWSFCSYRFDFRSDPMSSLVDMAIDFTTRWILTTVFLGIVMLVVYFSMIVLVRNIGKVI